MMLYIGQYKYRGITMGIIMRKRKCYTGKVKANKVKVVATANANQTFGQQLAQIKSVYNTLTSDEKYASFIVLERATYEEVYPYGGMHYSTTWVSGNGNLPITTVTWDLNTGKVRQASSDAAGVDITNVTNGVPIKLCIFI